MTTRWRARPHDGALLWVVDTVTRARTTAIITDCNCELCAAPIAGPGIGYARRSDEHERRSRPAKSDAVVAFSRDPGRPGADQPPLRRRADRCRRDAALRQGVPPQGARRHGGVGAPRQAAAAGDRGMPRRRLRHPRQGLRRRRAGPGAHARSAGSEPRRVRGELDRAPGADDAARLARRAGAALRHQLVPAGDAQVPPAARRGAGRRRSSCSCSRW